MDKTVIKFTLLFLLSGLVLLAACTTPDQPAATEVVPPTVTAVPPTTTTQPANTPVSAPSTSTAAPAVTAVPPAEPIVTAAYINVAGWSPDGRWLAYWASDQADVDAQQPETMPGGTLAFWDTTTGSSCSVPQFHMETSRDAAVAWSDDGSVTVIMPGGAYQGQPCEADSFAILADHQPPPTGQRDPALSLDGRFRIITSQTGEENGLLSYQTQLVETASEQERVAVDWQIDQRLGDYAGWLGGEWVSPTQFVIYETLEQGPLLLDADQGLISVLTDLLHQEAIPSILDENGVSLAARPIPGPAPDTYHLLIGGVGLEGNFPPIRLYHAESDLVETLPYRHLYWQPFSKDGQWLFLDSRPVIDGHETYEIWMRRVEDIEGEWQLLASDVDGVLWSPDETEMVYVRGETAVIWQTFPDGVEIAKWDTGSYWVSPVSFSPDGRNAALSGNKPGQWDSGLFVLARPAATGEATAVPEPETALPAGLVYRSDDGLWRVDADGQPQQLIANPYVYPSLNLARATAWDTENAIIVIDLATGSEQSFSPENGRIISFFSWADPQTVLVGLALEEIEGPNNGHLAVLNVGDGQFAVLDNERLLSSPPALSPSGETIAYPTFAGPMLYQADTGAQPFSLEGYAGLGDFSPVTFNSPAWSPDSLKLAWMVSGPDPTSPDDAWQTGLLIANLAQQTTQWLHFFTPAPIGAHPSAPVWSPDGEWLALPVNGATAEESGVWLIAADGSEERKLGGSNLATPVWLENGRLLADAVFHDDGRAGLELFDTTSMTGQVLESLPGLPVPITGNLERATAVSPPTNE